LNRRCHRALMQESAPSFGSPCRFFCATGAAVQLVAHGCTLVARNFS
jgi:hypothetical protein